MLAVADQPSIADPAATGATAGFASLYEREYAPMVRLARGMVDTTERAEEIVQESFAKVLQRWATLDNPGGYLAAGAPRQGTADQSAQLGKQPTPAAAPQQ